MAQEEIINVHLLEKSDRDKVQAIKYLQTHISK